MLIIYNVNISLTIKDETSVFEGIKQADVYIEPELLNEKPLIIPEVEKVINSEGVNNLPNKIEQNANYFKAKGNSIITNKKFNTLGNINGP